jgi:hypothetical protein
VKDFDEKKTDAPQDTAPGIVKPKGRAHSEGHDASHANPAAEALSAPQLSHPANAAPLADLLGHLQQSHGNIYVQRVVSEMNETKSGAESHATNSGQSLDGGVKTEMESAFGENFGDVRVHTGGAAEKMNEELGSRAVTRGRDVYFGRGEYDPSTRDGKEVLAHELTHVIQQGGRSGSQKANSIGQGGDAFEQEADQAAASVLSGERVRVANRSGVPAYQRKDEGVPPKIHDHGVDRREIGETVSTVFDDLIVDSLLSSVAGASVDTLHLTVPKGVAVTVVDLSGMNIQVRDPGGTDKRAIIIIVPRQARDPRLIQVTFMKGNRVDVLVYQLASTRASAPARAPAPAKP